MSAEFFKYDWVKVVRGIHAGRIGRVTKVRWIVNPHIRGRYEIFVKLNGSRADSTGTKFRPSQLVLVKIDRKYDREGKLRTCHVEESSEFDSQTSVNRSRINLRSDIGFRAARL